MEKPRRLSKCVLTCNAALGVGVAPVFSLCKCNVNPSSPLENGREDSRGSEFPFTHSIEGVNSFFKSPDHIFNGQTN